MKIKKSVNNKNKLLKLKLIKTKIFIKKFTIDALKIEDIEHRLKKNLQVIYKYHLLQKKILFISSSFITYFSNLLQFTNHEYIVASNSFSNKIVSKKFLNVTNRYDLLVSLDYLVDENTIKKNFKIKIPIVSMFNDKSVSNIKINYRIFGEFSLLKKKIKDHLLFYLLKSVLKK